MTLHAHSDLFEPSFRLDGLHALVCGASQGIGAATARSFARMGARVTLLARNDEKLKDTLNSLPLVESGAHMAVSADLSKPQDAIEKLQEKWGAKSNLCHILVNNSGGPSSGPLLKADAPQFYSALEQHILAAQLLIQYLAPGMKSVHFGRVINVLSTSVRIPLPNLGVSNIIRAGMASWSKTLASELADTGITVNCVLPGYTSTQRLAELTSAAALKQNQEVREIEANWKKNVPMQRFAHPEEIAGAICYFASPWASYVTGQCLAVDGGRTGSI